MKKITVKTEFPVAFDSPDHLVPLGTKKDNTRNKLFVRSCLKLLKKRKRTILKVLDIGCAGGGCVQDFVSKGHNAVGIEGSDYSKNKRRASWSKIPDRLFTCDASRPFTIFEDGEKMKFNLIYSFEVMEHIHPDRLKIYFKNIRNHLTENGIFIGTYTCTKSEKYPDHHQTVMGSDAWLKYIKDLKMFKIINLEWDRKQYLRSSTLKKNCIPVAFKKR